MAVAVPVVVAGGVSGSVVVSGGLVAGVAAGMVFSTVFSTGTLRDALGRPAPPLGFHLCARRSIRRGLLQATPQRTPPRLPPPTPRSSSSVPSPAHRAIPSSLPRYPLPGSLELPCPALCFHVLEWTGSRIRETATDPRTRPWPGKTRYVGFLGTLHNLLAQGIRCGVMGPESGRGGASLRRALRGRAGRQLKPR